LSTPFDSKIQLWGKWRGVEEYHPLLCHLIDVANVFQILFPRLARSISSADREALSQSRWLTLIAASHDIGKGAPAFEIHPGFSAPVIDIIKRRLAGLGLPCPSSTIAIPHGTITACVLPELLIALGLDPESAKIFARVVGGHHGNLPTANELARARMYPHLIGEGPWTALRAGIVNDLARLFSVLGDTPPRSPGGAAAIVLAGLVSIADWIGSIEAHFPYAVSLTIDPASIDLESYCARSRESAVKALRELHWLVDDSRSSIDDFAAIFPSFPPNDLQRVTKSNRRRLAQRRTCCYIGSC
jgi:CRISPR-associated endonuclease/helicase Cas3